MNTQKKETIQLFCNKCGKAISTEGNKVVEGVAQVELDWGYFSNKDGEHHSFCLCETCYDELVNSFKIPVAKKDNLELL